MAAGRFRAGLVAALAVGAFIAFVPPGQAFACQSVNAEQVCLGDVEGFEGTAECEPGGFSTVWTASASMLFGLPGDSVTVRVVCCVDDPTVQEPCGIIAHCSASFFEPDCSSGPQESVDGQFTCAVIENQISGMMQYTAECVDPMKPENAIPVVVWLAGELGP